MPRRLRRWLPAALVMLAAPALIALPGAVAARADVARPPAGRLRPGARTSGAVLREEGRLTALSAGAVPGATGVGTGVSPSPIPAGIDGYRLDVLLGLRTHAGLAALVRQLSDPSSPRYRHYPTVSSLARHYGASPRAIATVVRWLASAGVKGRIDPTRSYIDAPMTVRQASVLFETPFISLAEGGTVVIAAASSHVPAFIDRAVNVYTGLELLVSSRALPAPFKRSKPTEPKPVPGGTPAGCGSALANHGFTPNEISTAYGADTLHTAGFEGQGVTVGLIEEAKVLPAAVRTYEACFGLPHPPVIDYVGGTKPPKLPARTAALDASEAEGDAEILTTLAPRLSRIDVFDNTDSFGLEGFIEDLGTSLDRRVVGAHRPEVLSMSFDYCEPELLFDTRLVALFDRLAELSTAVGTTIAVSAGDTGATGCRAGEVAAGVVTDDYPASSPFVTAVGGTQLQLGSDNSIQAESVWNDTPYGFSAAGGGGVSVIERRPWYQAAIPAVGSTEVPGRDVPDVSFDASGETGYAFYCPQVCGNSATRAWREQFAGTSASAPLFAAGIALADQVAAVHGEPPLGLVNPLLYELGSQRSPVFNDVVGGTNSIVGTATQFSAGPGYDLASGWGSLHLDLFAAAGVAAGAR